MKSKKMFEDLTLNNKEMIEASKLLDRTFEKVGYTSEFYLILVHNFLVRKLYDFDFYLSNSTPTWLKEQVRLMKEEQSLSDCSQALNLLLENPTEDNKIDKRTFDIDVEVFWLRIENFSSYIKNKKLKYNEELFKLFFIWLLGFLEQKYTIKLLEEFVYKSKRKTLLVLSLSAITHLYHKEGNRVIMSTKREKDFENLSSIKFEDTIAYVEAEVEIIRINSPADILESINKINDTGLKVFFRGHSDINYKFLPSRFRNKKLIDNEYIQTQKLLSERYIDFKEFRFNIDILIKMQHYGFLSVVI